MTIKIVEKCMYGTSKNKYTGTRVVYYEVKEADNLLEALSSYENNFDSDNIISANDSFDLECLDSYIFSATVVSHTAKELDFLDNVDQ